MRLTTSPSPEFEPLSPPSGQASVRWLGQAGFLIEIAGKRIVIDPYLSDSLADKYRGMKFTHTRMMPVPIKPQDLRGVDWLFCTHAHTDHMDPGTIPALLSANPLAQVLVPSAERAKAIERGVPCDRMVTIDAGERRDLGGIWLAATASAHEEISRDAQGRYVYLGYVFGDDGVTLWHSGDTIPHAGLVPDLTPFAVDLALLPINGRDAERAANRVPGNLTVQEAVTLTKEIGARAMLGHHFDMFEFNTADPVKARRIIDGMGAGADILLTEMGVEYRISALGKT